MAEEKIEAKVIGSRFSFAIGKIEIHNLDTRTRLMAELPSPARPAAVAVLDTGRVTPAEMRRALRSKALRWDHTKFVREHTKLDYAFAALLLATAAPHWLATISALFADQANAHRGSIWGMLAALAVVTFGVLWQIVLPQRVAALIVQIETEDESC